MNYAAKTFDALKRRFSQKYDYCRGFALVGMNECCTSTPGCRPQLGGVC